MVSGRGRAYEGFISLEAAHRGAADAVADLAESLAEHPLPGAADPDFSANGLVTEIDGGIAIRTGV
ncbi:hypothetical protein, partial [Actinosynnema sp.]|uniref:hypothetical protein n=1 Tax=Actinosynnema sp. TaxID=1872144 RepID=UPI003F824FEF